MIGFEELGVRFEIPNNMDIELPSKVYEFLKEKDVSTDIIECFYTPLYWEDGYGTIRGHNYDGLSSLSWQEYCNLINEVHSYFPKKIQLLIQNDIVLPNKILQKYLDLGITKFCVGNFQQAKTLKELFPEVEITASITMQIHDYDLPNHPEYKEVFDNIILPFEYSRKLDKVNLLPLDYKYGLICNTHCSCFCRGIQHWTSPITIDGVQFSSYCPSDYGCPEFSQQNHLTRETFSSFIYPHDFKKFNKITIWKLVDRCMPTCAIISNLTSHILRYVEYITKGVIYNDSIDDNKAIDYNSYYKYVKQYNQYIRDHNLPHDIMPEE